MSYQQTPYSQRGNYASSPSPSLNSSSSQIRRNSPSPVSSYTRSSTLNTTPSQPSTIGHISSTDRHYSNQSSHRERMTPSRSSAFSSPNYAIPTVSYTTPSRIHSPSSTQFSQSQREYSDRLSEYRRMQPSLAKSDKPTQSLDLSEKQLHSQGLRPSSPSSPRRSLSDGLSSSLHTPTSIRKSQTKPIATIRRAYSNSCPICSKEFDDEELFLNHIYESECAPKIQKISAWDEVNPTSEKDKAKKRSISISLNSERAERDLLIEKPVEKPLSPDPLPSVSFVDRSFSEHSRVNTVTNKTVVVEKLAIISSRRDQFYFGGKSACTTIAIEAAIQLLQGINRPGSIQSWNEKVIDKIVKVGCMQDPQRGNMSFHEVCEAIPRFKEQLEVLDEGQDTINSGCFEATVNQIIDCAKRNRRSVCTIITRQPETILLYYKYRSDEQQADFFLALDSHPRTTDDQSHGAHVIYFLRDSDNEFGNVSRYLDNWLFPAIDFDSDTMNEMYNTYAYTIVAVARDKEGNEVAYAPFLVEPLDESRSPSNAQSPSAKIDTSQLYSQLEQLKSTNDLLKSQLEEKDKKILEYEQLFQKLKRATNKQLTRYQSQITEVLNKVKSDTDEVIQYFNEFKLDKDDE